MLERGFDGSRPRRDFCEPLGEQILVRAPGVQGCGLAGRCYYRFIESKRRLRDFELARFSWSHRGYFARW